MQAIELNAVITENHEIHLRLPDEVMATHAKVIVIYENKAEQKQNDPPNKQWATFFASKSVFMDDFLAERDNEIPQTREFY
ncbi:MAG: hypothetical protein HOP02_05875 [Methylococcaceae bacterium]|nr:hypothetical protein [Methylococcaceae bacterium]